MDFELLQAFARAGDQPALAQLVRRHLDLVFGTALRKVEDAGAAEEIAQNVFAVLARKAWQFAPDDSLPAWLHKTALLESQSWLRGELRRRRREQTAAELGTTMKTPDEQPALRALVPLLDDALLSLREKDRTALLLRFYESQSLRDVGGALGVSEDAAQKRVASALEQVVQFFQRRGFRMATTAVAIGALQHTATSASASTAALVGNATLQAAPPALAGLGLLLARLASLTKVQTVALCVAVAAGPLGWGLNRTHRAEQSGAGLRTKLEAARTQEKQWSTDIERMQMEVGRLQVAKREAGQAQERNAAVAQQVEALKQRIRGLLTDDDYRWPDDLPFVRIPKSAVAALEVGLPIIPPGAVVPPARELFGLTPEELQRTQNALGRYFAEVEQRVAENVYETNRPQKEWMIRKEALASRVFGIPALGKEAGESAERLMSEMAEALGAERWALIQPALGMSGGSHALRRILNLDAGKDSQEIVVWLSQSDNTPPTVGFTWSGGTSGSFGSSGLPLAEFLPSAGDGDAKQSPMDLRGTYLPTPLIDRVNRWLGEEATSRLADTSKP